MSLQYTLNCLFAFIARKHGKPEPRQMKQAVLFELLLGRKKGVQNYHLKGKKVEK